MFALRAPRMLTKFYRMVTRPRQNISVPNTVRPGSHPPSSRASLQAGIPPFASKHASKIDHPEDKKHYQQKFLASHTKVMGLMDQKRMEDHPNCVKVYSPNALYQSDVMSHILQGMDTPDAHLALFEALKPIFAERKEIAVATPDTGGRPVDELIVPADKIAPYRVLVDSRVELNLDEVNADQSAPSSSPSP